MLMYSNRLLGKSNKMVTELRRGKLLIFLKKGDEIVRIFKSQIVGSFFYSQGRGGEQVFGFHDDPVSNGLFSSISSYFFDYIIQVIAVRMQCFCIKLNVPVPGKMRFNKLIELF